MKEFWEGFTIVFNLGVLGVAVGFIVIVFLTMIIMGLIGVLLFGGM